MEIDPSSLHKIIGDMTRRNILELLAEKRVLSYTDVMSLLNITNTGRLNYHLRILGELIEKGYILNLRELLFPNGLHCWEGPILRECR
ncbi:MAG: helix-turn-helix domain-containing protein [Nitrososphaeria archaeon]